MNLDSGRPDRIGEKMERNFSLKNINLSAYLLSTGKIKLSKVDRTNPREMSFFFDPPETASKLLEEYFLGNALVDPKTLFSKLNELRDIALGGGKYG